MEQQAPPTVTTTTVSSAPGIFGTNIPTAVAFIIAVVLFLLPFAQLKCNGAPFAENTGIGIAMGTKWKEVVSKNILDDNADKNNSSISDDKQQPNVWAIVAIVLGIIGLLLSFSNTRVGIAGAMISGCLSAIALLGLLFDLKNKVKVPKLNGLRNPESNRDFNFNTSVTLDFTPWFYLALIAFLLAALFSWQRSQKKV